jgi:hypothetical protein
MIPLVMNVFKASGGSIPTDFTSSSADKEGSLRLVLECVKFAWHDGAGKTDLGIYHKATRFGNRLDECIPHPYPSHPHLHTHTGAGAHH